MGNRVILKNNRKLRQYFKIDQGVEKMIINMYDAKNNKCKKQQYSQNRILKKKLRVQF